MKNGKIFIFIFIFAFIFLLFLFINDVKSFTFTVNNKEYDTDNLDIELQEYTVIFVDGYKNISVVSCDEPATYVNGFCFKGHINQCKYYSSSGKWISNSYYPSLSAVLSSDYFVKNPSDLIYLNYDLKDDEGNIVIASQVKNTPYIVNKDEIATGKFSKIVINSGNYNTFANQIFYLFSYYYSENSVDAIYPRKEIQIGGVKNEIDTYSSEFLVGTNGKGNYIYEIPISVTNIDLVQGNKYGFRLAILNAEGNYEYIDDISFTIGGVTTEEKEQADRDKQLAIQEEQNKTNKGIFETLKDVLSYINPFSENFFVYKLIELLIEAIKGLFIPSDDFFTKWINDMNEWLSDRLGALYYPVDLVIDFLNRIGQLNSTGSAVISGNGFEFMKAQLIPAFSYDFNSLLTNDTLKNIHDIYLTVVDVILYLCLIVLAKNTFIDIFGGQYDSGFEIISDGVDGSVETQNKLTRNKIALENRRARYNYYSKRRNGKI